MRLVRKPLGPAMDTQANLYVCAHNGAREPAQGTIVEIAPPAGFRPGNVGFGRLFRMDTNRRGHYW